MDVYHHHAGRIALVNHDFIQGVREFPEVLALDCYVQQIALLLPGFASDVGIHREVKSVHADVAQKAKAPRVDAQNGDGAVTHERGRLEHGSISAKGEQQIHALRHFTFVGHEAGGKVHVFGQFGHVGLGDPSLGIQGQNPVQRRAQIFCIVGRNRFSKEGNAHEVQI